MEKNLYSMKDVYKVYEKLSKLKSREEVFAFVIQNFAFLKSFCKDYCGVGQQIFDFIENVNLLTKTQAEEYIKNNCRTMLDFKIVIDLVDDVNCDLFQLIESKRGTQLVNIPPLVLNSIETILRNFRDYMSKDIPFSDCIDRREFTLVESNGRGYKVKYSLIQKIYNELQTKCDSEGYLKVILENFSLLRHFVVQKCGGSYRDFDELDTSEFYTQEQVMEYVKKKFNNLEVIWNALDGIKDPNYDMFELIEDVDGSVTFYNLSLDDARRIDNIVDCFSEYMENGKYNFEKREYDV